MHTKPSVNVKNKLSPYLTQNELFDFPFHKSFFISDNVLLPETKILNRTILISAKVISDLLK